MLEYFYLHFSTINLVKKIHMGKYKLSININIIIEQIIYQQNKGFMVFFLFLVEGRMEVMWIWRRNHNHATIIKFWQCQNLSKDKFTVIKTQVATEIKLWEELGCYKKNYDFCRWNVPSLIFLRLCSIIPISVYKKEKTIT